MKKTKRYRPFRRPYVMTADGQADMHADRMVQLISEMILMRDGIKVPGTRAPLGQASAALVKVWRALRQHQRRLRLKEVAQMKKRARQAKRRRRARR